MDAIRDHIRHADDIKLSKTSTHYTKEFVEKNLNVSKNHFNFFFILIQKKTQKLTKNICLYT